MSIGKYQSWVSKQRGNPMLLLVAVVSATAGILIFHRNFYKPWARKIKTQEAEDYAKFIYEKETNSNT